MKRFLIALVALLPLAVNAATDVSKFPAISLNNQTNIISDNGSALTFNGTPIGGSSYWELSGSNLIPAAGLPQTDRFRMRFDGSIVVGPVVSNVGYVSGLSNSVSIVSVGPSAFANTSGQAFAADDLSAAFSGWDAEPSVNGFFFDSYTYPTNSTTFFELDWNLNPSNAALNYWEFVSDVAGGIHLKPWSDGGGEINFDFASAPRESGTIFRVGNSTTNLLTVEYDGSMTAATGTNITATELGYVSGVTSAIQTQINSKSDIPTQIALTHAGTVTLTNTALQSWATLGLTGNVTFATSGLQAGCCYTVYGINPQATNCTPTFPSGWLTPTNRFIGGAPSTITAGKAFVLSIFSTGTSDTNVWATYAEGL